LSGDWMALAFERFQNATRSVRLTLPPGRDEQFWNRLVELAKLKDRRLSFSILLPSNPLESEKLAPALNSINELDKMGHELVWSANGSLPFSLFIVDDAWALVVVGDPDSKDESFYSRLTDDSEETRQLRKTFDNRFNKGSWGVNPESWMDWLENLNRNKATRNAISAFSRGDKNLNKISKKVFKQFPKRNYWIIKPHDSAYGIEEPPGISHWAEWLKNRTVSMGWGELTRSFHQDNTLPEKEEFKQLVRKHYPWLRQFDRAYSTARHFVESFDPGDRIISMDGWTSRQDSPVRFHGWGRVDGSIEQDRSIKGWTLARDASWYRYEIELPISVVKEVSGLNSCTYPIHSISGQKFKDMIEIAGEFLLADGQSQMSLELNSLDRLSGQHTLL
jgi:hypothetical protein